MQQAIAVVTGASRGIGRAIAQSLIDADYFVVASATSESGVAAIKEYLGEHGTAFVLNLSDKESCAEFIKNVTELGSASVLVNNAGITKDTLMLRMKDDDWDSVIETNLSGAFRLTKGLLKGMMKQRWGRIVNISSVVGAMGNPGQVNYCASKAGIEGFTRSLAYEIGSRGITVNAVAPGFIATDMTDELTDDQKNTMMANIPVGRYGEPEEIAKAVAFLVSKDAAYITGQVLNVNGGLNMG
ncbi:3-oxoacyl-ACP reductase FabG [Bermanella sp. WJH001]|uniref:3-oxoacyl-ACP reductase FabG n=1 Tax=Bermanella sp. WJH001 TaxID=3048005 RepID=UPI0024BE19EF|nr:3-oxoacyl-ACP reductase FabG [Bermanella sp. WJH001]MDJ1537171.1 3-oxoacyl-ACP reductase FabG [Bermanella sp. WJH001]